MSRILLTGGRGFVGAPLLRRLLARGDEIVATTSGPVPPPRLRGTPDVEWRSVDLRDADAARAVARAVRPDVLVHCAWELTPGRYVEDPGNARWATAGAALADGALRGGARRLVGLGTCAEYDPRAPAPFDETTTPATAATPYGAAKARLHAEFREHAARAGVTAAWARLFFLYGPGEPEGKLVRSVATAVLAGRPAHITAGTQRRDFLHVEDAAAAIAALVRSPVGGAVNVGSGAPVTVDAMAREVCAAAGRPDLLRVGALATDDRLAADITGTVTRLREEVGVPEPPPRAQRVAETVDWWRVHRA